MASYHRRLEKTALNQGRTDCISLTHDLDLQSPASYGHDLPAYKSSRSTVSRFQRWSGNKQTGGEECITSHANAICRYGDSFHVSLLLCCLVWFRCHTSWLSWCSSGPPCHRQQDPSHPKSSGIGTKYSWRPVLSYQKSSVYSQASWKKSQGMDVFPSVLVKWSFNLFQDERLITWKWHLLEWLGITVTNKCKLFNPTINLFVQCHQ